MQKTPGVPSSQHLNGLCPWLAVQVSPGRCGSNCGGLVSSDVEWVAFQNVVSKMQAQPELNKAPEVT